MYAYERFSGWHRMVNLRVPERLDALGGAPAGMPGPAHTPRERELRASPGA